MKRIRTLGLLVPFALAACTSTGMGGGELMTKGKPDEPVLFSWQSRDGGITGDLVATVGDDAYRGRFLQVTRETTRDAIEPMWTGWYGGWNRWRDPWIGDVDMTTFSRSYSGRVLANLSSSNKGNMRCRFQLENPSRGMSGGGQGECQLSDGRRIDANIERKG